MDIETLAAWITIAIFVYPIIRKVLAYLNRKLKEWFLSVLVEARKQLHQDDSDDKSDPSYVVWRADRCLSKSRFFGRACYLYGTVA